MSDYAATARALVRVLGPKGARQLLMVLDKPDPVRADLFHQLYERGGSEPLLEALYELEANSIMRGWLAEYLRLELGPT